MKPKLLNHLLKGEHTLYAQAEGRGNEKQVPDMRQSHEVGNRGDREGDSESADRPQFLLLKLSVDDWHMCRKHERTSNTMTRKLLYNSEFESSIWFSVGNLSQDICSGKQHVSLCETFLCNFQELHDVTHLLPEVTTPGRVGGGEGIRGENRVTRCKTFANAH